MSTWIKAFVNRLAQLEGGPDTTNFYSEREPGNMIRRQNLTLYLQGMVAQRPLLLLVGEAPGYRGCRLTGIPFTSEALIQAGLPKWNLLGMEQRFACVNESVTREATATMVWEAVSNCRTLPLFWNSYPLHPHKPGNPNSNRPPTQHELQIGQPILQELCTRFETKIIVAVGNQAAKVLEQIGRPYVKLRHPSHGGKQLFTKGLHQLESSLL